MTATSHIGTLLPERTVRDFVGRREELRRLEALLGPAGGVQVVHVHGDAGIGKSALVTAFLRRMRDADAKTIGLDCRSIEPTERGLLEALAVAGGSSDQGVGAVAMRLGAMGSTVVVALDHLEVFRLMDTWLRQVLVPNLNPHVRILLAGREPPVAAWFAAGSEHLFRGVALGPLPDAEAELVLEHRGHDHREARRLNRIARGHPLALTLASEAARERPDLMLEEAATARVVPELARMYLEVAPDPLTRRALEGAAVVRRVTRPLLRAMLADADADGAFDRLLALPFVDCGSDGLLIHDAVRASIASFLHSTDPGRHRDLRRSAWRQLRTEVRAASDTDLWRYTADMLYLIVNPVVREAFFPSGSQPLAVEPARPQDEPSVMAIAARHDGSDAVAQLADWWERFRSSFSVVRDRDGSVRAFFVLLDTQAVMSLARGGDPVVAAWRQHLRDDPMPKGQVALGLRRWLDIDCGEGPCPAQAACWLDTKRTYMAMRPELRRMYVTVRDPAPYATVIERLGFRPLPAALGRSGQQGSGVAPPAVIGGDAYTSVVLDFGAGSVDGWLARLVAAELGLKEDRTLDPHAREVILNGRRVALTRLEFGVLQRLDAVQGRTVSRADLLRDVWGYQYTGGSNIVDAAVRSLRRKMGDSGVLVEAVRGVGYRLREDWRALVT